MESYNAKYIDSNTTTLVKTGSGVLHCITINAAAAGSVTVYDGISAAAPASVLAIIKASAAEGPYIYDIAFDKGLTIVTAHADSDLTVSYK
jgi:hypothetical protein